MPDSNRHSLAKVLICSIDEESFNNPLRPLSSSLSSKEIGETEIGNSQVEIAYELMDGVQPLLLRWMPTGDATVRFRMLNLKDDLSPERLALLAARMGGSLPEKKRSEDLSSNVQPKLTADKAIAELFMVLTSLYGPRQGTKN